jgi:hypothetical protein
MRDALLFLPLLTIGCEDALLLDELWPGVPPAEEGVAARTLGTDGANQQAIDLATLETYAQTPREVADLRLERTSYRTGVSLDLVVGNGWTICFQEGRHGSVWDVVDAPRPCEPTGRHVLYLDADHVEVEGVGASGFVLTRREEVIHGWAHDLEVDHDAGGWVRSATVELELLPDRW